MTNVNDLNIKFNNKFEKKILSDNSVKIIFFNKKRKISYIPSWFDQKIISFLEKTASSKDIKNLTLFRSEFGSFLIIFDDEQKDENKRLSNENLGGKAYDVIKKNFFKTINIFLEDVELACNFLYGFCLKSYKFDNYKSDKKGDFKKNINLISDNYVEIKKSFNVYIDIINGVFFTRDLVWKPANILKPATFVNECKKLSKKGIKISIFDEKKLKQLGMHALLAVGNGSSQPSYVVVMEWKGGTKKDKPMAFIGKGVCFDSGGLSLKPSKSMEDMKWDMGGAGVVTGLMDSIAGSKLKRNVIGVIGLVENMPDGNAQRPGDVITSISGKTIEVLNTDAEGRLVLADLLAWTEEKFNPIFMINLATLTGAMIVALGNIRAGMFSNNNKLIEKIFKSGEKTGDKVWNMPLDDEYDKMINTEIADMKNIGGIGAGSITAACFLKRHIKKTAWAHLDIAGVTWNNKPSDTNPYGASGWGVKLLFDLIKNFDYKM